MRKSFYALLVLFVCASGFAQTLRSPVHSQAVTSTKPTFTWAKNTLATGGYQIVLLTTPGDTSVATIPLTADAGKWKRFVQVGSTANDTTVTLDTILARSASLRYWKVRYKTSASVYGTWVYASGRFLMTLPATTIENSNATVKIDHDVYSAVRQLTFKGGSSKQSLDTVYNDSKKFGLGATGLLSTLGTRDTLVSWDVQSTYSVYKYQNFGKYGKTGSKILTITHGTDGITVDDSLTLETGKTVYVPCAFKPAGDFANDNVILYKTSATKTAVGYTALAFGADSIKYSAFYDSKYPEVFGFKADSLFAVKDTQNASLLQQTATFTAVGATKGFKLSFGVRKSRLDYFQTWVQNRPMFVSNVTTTSADTLVRGLNYIKYETFGANPDTLKYSDNGTTYTKTFVIGKDTSCFLDSVQVRIPNGVYGATSVVKLVSDSGDVAVSEAFKVSDRYVTVTSPKSTDSFTPDSQKVTWTNATGVALTKIEVSTDSGSTWGSTKTISSLLALDTTYFNFTGKSTKCFVRVFNAVGDTGISEKFTLQRYITVTSPTISSSFTPDSQYVKWINYTGNAVTKVSLSVDSGATYATPIVISSTATTDSLKFYFKGKSTKCFVRVTNGGLDTSTSALFTLQRYITVTNPLVTDSFVPDSQYVKWINYTGGAVTKVSVSTDSGVTYSTPIVVNSTATTDSLYFYFNGKSTKCFVRVTNGGLDTASSPMFTLRRFITVTKPILGASITAGAESYVVWENRTGIAITKVKVSLDSGSTWIDSASVSSSTAVYDSLLYVFRGAKTSKDDVYARVFSTANVDTGMSPRFGIGSGGAIFNPKPVFGDPGGTVWVPVYFNDGVAGDSLKSFDMLMTFDSSYIKYMDIDYNAKLEGGKWFTIEDSAHATGVNASYVRVSCFKNTTGAGIKSDTIFSLKFSINDKQANIGKFAALTIKNSSLNASGNNALVLSVTGSTNDSIGIYSSVEGNLHYLHDIGSPSYQLSGDSLMSYKDNGKAANSGIYNVTGGYYKMASREPGNTIVVAPDSMQYLISAIAAITSTDAQLAWKDWKDTLHVRHRIPADVNGDGAINTSDAMAIMEISVDSTYCTRNGLSNLIFADSASLVAYEVASDSMTAWFNERLNKLESTLSSQQKNQDFFGVLRGDVNLSYATGNITTLGKSSETPVVVSTDESIKARPGDVVWIPMNLNTNGASIGGFNASMQIDPSVFTYAGEYKMGSAMPQDKDGKNYNWYVAAKSDANGLLRVAATDFSLTINPITQDGPVLLFKYIVNKDTKFGTNRQVTIGSNEVVDNNMQMLARNVKSGQVEVTRMGNTVVTEYALAQNYPNPFNPSTTIEFALPMDSKVDIVIYNILGQQVKSLFSGVQTVGYHQVDFNASQMASGIYFYTIKASSLTGNKSFNAVKKMMLVK